MKQLRVLSYNIQHCHPYAHKGIDSVDFDLFADHIRVFDADVIGLNEVRGEGEGSLFDAQAQILADKLGYHYRFAPAIQVKNGGPYGNAILSKVPLEDFGITMIPDPVRKPDVRGYETRCVAKATLPVAGGITLLVTHFGLKPEEEQNAVETVCKLIRESEHPVILTGDFNVTPEDPVLSPIRELLCDTASIFTRPQLSYPSDEPTMKIDYIFASESLRPVFAAIPQMIVSDHRPYLAVFAL